MCERLGKLAGGNGVLAEIDGAVKCRIDVWCYERGVRYMNENLI